MAEDARRQRLAQQFDRVVQQTDLLVVERLVGQLAVGQVRAHARQPQRRVPPHGRHDAGELLGAAHLAVHAGVEHDLHLAAHARALGGAGDIVDGGRRDDAQQQPAAQRVLQLAPVAAGVGELDGPQHHDRGVDLRQRHRLGDRRDGERVGEGGRAVERVEERLDHARRPVAVSVGLDDGAEGVLRAGEGAQAVDVVRQGRAAHDQPGLGRHRATELAAGSIGGICGHGGRNIPLPNRRDAQPLANQRPLPYPITPRQVSDLRDPQNRRVKLT